jgi:hypothetical protein
VANFAAVGGGGPRQTPFRESASLVAGKQRIAVSRVRFPGGRWEHEWGEVRIGDKRDNPLNQSRGRGLAAVAWDIAAAPVTGDVSVK